jgi:hypothetical protein
VAGGAADGTAGACGAVAGGAGAVVVLANERPKPFLSTSFTGMLLRAGRVGDVATLLIGHPVP